MKILIVDDNVDSVKSAALYLGQCGFDTEGAYSGAGAENVLSQAKFDVIILDYRISDLNGLDVMRWMRFNDIDTPVILTTGVDPDAVEEIKLHAESEQLGPVVVMNKPYDGDALLNTIGILVSQSPGTTTKITHTVESTVTVTQEAAPHIEPPSQPK